VLLAHPSPELYGSDRMLLASVQALVGAGRRAVVVLPKGGPLEPELRAAGAAVRLLDVPVLRRSAMSPGGLIRLAAGVLRTLPAMLRVLRDTHPDVVYVSTLTQPSWLLAARLARVRAVCHVHEAEQRAGRTVRTLLAAPLLLADVVLVNSAAARDALDVLPRAQARSRVLHNGVPGPPCPPEPAHRSGPAHLVVVGRLSPRKGTDVALAALARLASRGADVRLSLVGDAYTGYEWYAQRLQQQVADDGLDERVAFAGFQADVWPWLAAADVVLVPSREEPFGNVAVEAALALRPVVASAVQGLLEIVEPGVSGVLVAPDDPAALAEAVDGLLADPAQALALAERARSDALARFGLEQYGRGLLDALEA